MNFSLRTRHLQVSLSTDLIIFQALHQTSFKLPGFYICCCEPRNVLLELRDVIGQIVLEEQEIL